MAVVVEGIRELQILFAVAPKEANKDLRDSLKGVAEPIRLEWETLARTSIRRIGPDWYKARTGVIRGLVYVAPKMRGRLTQRDPARYRRGEQFATLLRTRAVDPALAKHEHNIEQAVGHVFEDLTRKWNRA